MRIAPSCILVILASCAEETPPAAPRDPNRIDLVLQESGVILRDGRPVTLESIAAWARTGDSRVSTEPVRIQVPERDPFEKLHPLLESLMKSHRVNIGLLHRGSRKEPVLLPIKSAHGCHTLHFFNGATEINEHSKPKPDKRVWIRMRVDAGGMILVEGIQLAQVDPTETILMGPDEKGRAATPNDLPWTGIAPPIGRWESKTLKTFLEIEEVRVHMPVCILEIRPEDRMGDVTVCLSAIQSVGAPWVLAHLPTR